MPLAGVGQLLALAIWLGAALYFSAAVAPAAFSVLPTRELAGALVGRTLPVVFVSGAAVGVVSLLLETGHRPRRFRVGRVVAGASIVASCLVAQLIVAPRIAALRASLAVPLAALSTDHPQRIAFGRLHMISVAWLAIAMLAAAIGVLLAAYTLRSEHST